MSAPSSAKGSPTQGDSQATSFNTPGAQPDLAEIQAQQLAQAGLIADLQTKVGNLDEKFTAKFDAILARLDRAPEHRSTSAEDAAAAKAAAEKAEEKAGEKAEDKAEAKLAKAKEAEAAKAAASKSMTKVNVSFFIEHPVSVSLRLKCLSAANEKT